MPRTGNEAPCCSRQGLKGFSLVNWIQISDAFPSIPSGLKVGWAFAWHGLIAAELVAGVSPEKGGLGGHIFENRNQLAISNVFADLFLEITIGLVAGKFVFVTIEEGTNHRWGMWHEAPPAF